MKNENIAQELIVVEILPTKIWIENDIFGSRHVVLQHDGMEPFTYATFGYSYAYTSNSETSAMAKELAMRLGATEPVEQRHRNFVFPVASQPNEPL